MSNEQLTKAVAPRSKRFLCILTQKLAPALRRNYLQTKQENEC